MTDTLTPSGRSVHPLLVLVMAVSATIVATLIVGAVMLDARDGKAAPFHDPIAVSGAVDGDPDVPAVGRLYLDRLEAQNSTHDRWTTTGRAAQAGEPRPTCPLQGPC